MTKIVGTGVGNLPRPEERGRVRVSIVPAAGVNKLSAECGASGLVAGGRDSRTLGRKSGVALRIYD